MDCIFNSQELELAVDEEVHLLVEVELNAVDAWLLLDVLSHEWSVHASKVCREKGRKTQFCPT